MTNKKETLIKTLRGSVEQLNRLEDMMDGLTVMDETDHVDNDFLMVMLTCVNAFMDASNDDTFDITLLLASINALTQVSISIRKRKTIR